jgi:hypothetical protein
VEKHKREAREKEAVNAFVWAREGEHIGANLPQCQLVNRVAEEGKVWVKWTSTGKISCIPASNIEEPTQGQEQKHSMFIDAKMIPKKRRMQRSTTDTDSPDSPVPLSTETTVSPSARMTRSSGAKCGNGKNPHLD